MNILTLLQNYWDRLVKKISFLWRLPHKKPVDFPFARSDIAMLYRSAKSDDVKRIDEHTAKDMLLDAYADRLAVGSSIFAQQMLHQRLRVDTQDNDGRQRLQKLIADPVLHGILQQHCLPLREVEIEISEQIFTHAIPDPAAWYKFMWLLPVGTILLLLLALTSTAYAWLAVVLAWGVLLALQARYSDRIEEWSKKLQTLRALLKSFNSLENQAPSDTPTQTEDGNQAHRIMRSLSRPAFMFLPVVKEYTEWFLLDNIRHYFKTCMIVRNNQDFLRRVYLRVANLEADLALVRHLQSVPQYCWSSPASGKRLHLQHVVHPLLQQASALSIALEGKGAFVSGQNGIGKSTLLRTIGLNLIVARAFGFCYAASASVPVGAVYSSMQSEDSLMVSESLYQAELRRAKELLDVAGSHQQTVFVIDEIFRGTNHQESISAAAAVLQSLSSSSMVIVSSHNLVLAPLLESYLTPLCVVADHSDKSRLQLTEGVLADPNGIRLLSSYGFGEDIKNKASRVFDWLSDYLIHPDKCEQLLESSGSA
ncbi:MutS-related protein [Undibacterium sp. Di26W]|uniref:MutS-related protein n=1 Tax=Undibacterium sp. Di26W TaxID=3413035 RepID=UPI003BF02F5C